MNKKDFQNRCLEYRKNLSSAFRFLGASSKVQQYSRPTAESCGKNLTVLQGLKASKHSEWFVDFRPNWHVPISNSIICGVKGEASLIIGGQVSVDERAPKVVQSITACLLLTPEVNVRADAGYDCGDLKKGVPIVVRRFHFDYDVTIAANDRPRSHLQYGGKLKRDVEDMGDATYQLFSSLDVPRIPHAPYDPILVFDLFLRQFETPLIEVIEDSSWKAIVRQSEELWVKRYYGEINTHFGSAANKDTLHARQCRHIDWLE